MNKPICTHYFVIENIIKLPGYNDSHMCALTQLKCLFSSYRLKVLKTILFFSIVTGRGFVLVLILCSKQICKSGP